MNEGRRIGSGVLGVLGSDGPYDCVEKWMIIDL